MQAHLPILAPLFFLSGASALIYQILWLRLLALVFGVTVYAATAVLASFMGRPGARQLQHRQTRRALHLGSFRELLDLYVSGPQELRAFVGRGPIITDDRPLLEYFKSLPPTGPTDVNIAALKADVMRHVR